MWDFIINPFITVLTFLYSILGNNIVLAIIVFTIIIRVLTFPLTMQQMKSSKAMQQLQPELKKIQEKHKDDREKLSQEQMKLYREHGINPFGGCLPLLIQMPILIGLYQAIIFALGASPYQMLELSGRLLIPGLDTLVPLQNTWLGLNLTQPPSAVNAISYALPVLVVVTTWIQFRLTMPPAPKTSDDEKPNQAAAMTQSMGTMMPLMYGFFSLSFSVGLSIYFIVSNLVGIAQSALTGNIDWKNVDLLGGLGGFFASRPQTRTRQTPATVPGRASGSKTKRKPSKAK